MQDKVGPFARSAADAAVVLDTVRGRDPADPSSFDADLQDPFSLNVQSLTVGVLPNTPSIVRSIGQLGLRLLYITRRNT